MTQSDQEQQQQQTQHTGNGVPPTFIQHVRQRQLKRQRDKEYTRQLAASIASGCLTGTGYFIGRLLFAPMAAWYLMLLVGVIHGSWLSSLPTIGYWPALAVTALTILTVPLLRPLKLSLPSRKAERSG